MKKTISIVSIAFVLLTAVAVWAQTTTTRSIRIIKPVEKAPDVQVTTPSEAARMDIRTVKVIVHCLRHNPRDKQAYAVSIDWPWKSTVDLKAYQFRQDNQTFETSIGAQVDSSQCVDGRPAELELVCKNDRDPAKQNHYIIEGSFRSMVGQVQRKNSFVAGFCASGPRPEYYLLIDDF